MVNERDKRVMCMWILILIKLSGQFLFKTKLKKFSFKSLNKLAVY